MKILKQILWLVLAYFLITCLHGMATTSLHPYGGNEYHAIFSDLGGGRLDVAYKVYAEYAVIASVLVFLMILFKYPAHWFLVLALGSWIAWKRWCDICFFPHQSEAFHQVVVRLGLVIAPIVTCLGFSAKILLWWGGRKGQGSAPVASDGSVGSACPIGADIGRRSKEKVGG